MMDLYVDADDVSCVIFHIILIQNTIHMESDIRSCHLQFAICQYNFVLLVLVLGI